MRRPRLSLVVSSTRSRVLIAALGLLAGTIAVSILVDRTVLLSRLDERIDRELSQEVGEFRRLAGGVDPETGDAFGEDVVAIFDTFFDRNVPGDDEVFLGLVDGRPYLRSANAPYPIEELEDVVARWADATEPSFATDSTPEGTLRSLVVPIAGADGSTTGSFVVAKFPAGERAEVDEAVRVAAAVGTASFVIAALLAWAIAGRVLAPLGRLAAGAAAIDVNDLSHRIPEQGSGELADLTETFNAMLDRVDRAFATQRAFLDDASHELRTPITIVRGHLELVDPEQPLPAETKDLVLDELDRMARIVDDLLTMAKAERPDFIERGPVDVADLTQDIADKAAALGTREWSCRPEAVIVARLDRQRVVQAWMNLVRNALQHTGAGDEIVIFSEVVGGDLAIGVADHGEGVAPEDRDRVFDRFSRGRSARRTRSDGAGLGLSIAAAVASGHGGTIEHRDTPGGGATFVITLPVEPDPNEENPWPAS